jgi:hypothetical protein
MFLGLLSGAQAAGKMYWTDAVTNKIQRANLDGTGAEDLVTGLFTPHRIALDVCGGKMYWTDSGDNFDPNDGKMQRANLDGTGVEDLVTGLQFPIGLALDVSGGKMYWIDRGIFDPNAGTGKIQRANLDGTGVEDLLTGLIASHDIALDVSAGKMYWTDASTIGSAWTGRIRRANLDGTGVEDLVTGLIREDGRGLALDISGGKMYWINCCFTGPERRIQRANLDGTGVEDLVTGLDFAHGIALDVSAGKMYWLEADFDDVSRIRRANLDGSGVGDLVNLTAFSLPGGIALDVVEVQPGAVGAVLAQFTPGAPCAAGPGGRGMAFDGTDLYYTIAGDTNIYKVGTAGNCLGTIPVDQSQGTIGGGPLAWDGSALWTMDYALDSFTLYRVSPADGSILSSCNIATQNPGHPAVTGAGAPPAVTGATLGGAPNNIGEFPDGLDWTGSTLWVSNEAIPGFPGLNGNWVVEVDTNCNILTAFNPVTKGGRGPSGVAFDGDDLWHAYIFGSTPIVQTDVAGTETGPSFTGVGNHEDLACDPVTFCPKAALWANESTFGPNRLTAFEIPQCAKGIGPPNQPPVAKCQDVEATADGQCLAGVSVDGGSLDPDGDPITLTQNPPGPYGLGVTAVTLTVQDNKGASDSCQATVKVKDFTLPSIRCSAPAFITPRDVPVSFTARADDNCSVADIQIAEYQCWSRNPAGIRVDRDCVVTIAGDTITIEDSGGVGANVDWLVTAVDDSGNEASRWCLLDVRRPRFPQLP